MQNLKTTEPATEFSAESAARTAFSVEASFEQVRHLLSDRPLRRYQPRLTPAQVDYIRDRAKTAAPPQAWYDEDLSGLQ